MRILFFIKKLSNVAGGAERVLCDISNNLVNRGHLVSIITFDKKNDRPFYKLDNKINLLNLQLNSFDATKNFLKILKGMISLRRVILSEQPDVVIGFMHSGFIPLAFCLIGTGIPIVGSEHIVPKHYLHRKIAFFLFKVATKFLSKITVLSEKIRQKYPKNIRYKMVVMPNPIKNKVKNVKKIKSKDNHILLNVGRLDYQKDQVTLIHAFYKISHNFPNWNLRIIGEGPLRDDLEKTISTLSLQERVFLPGVTSNIDNEYNLADIFVIPSIYEAFGLVTAEAMLHGLPTVGFTNCSGTNVLIKDGITGILVDPKEDRVKALAKSLSHLMRNPKLQMKYGKAGQKDIKTYYSINEVCNKWENLLTEQNKNKLNK